MPTDKTLALEPAKLIESKLETEARPWARYSAKMSDMLIFSLPYAILLALLGTALGMWLAQQPNSELDNLLFGNAPATDLLWSVISVLLLFLFFPLYEAILISNFATTPGKALMGIQLVDNEGNKLSFGQSYKRSVGALVMGMAAGIPLINIITMIVSFNKLTSEGETAWDRETETTYISNSINPIRWVVGVALVIANMGLSVAERFLV